MTSPSGCKSTKKTGLCLRATRQAIWPASSCSWPTRFGTATDWKTAIRNPLELSSHRRRPESWEHLPGVEPLERALLTLLRLHLRRLDVDEPARLHRVVVVRRGVEGHQRLAVQGVRARACYRHREALVE